MKLLLLFVLVLAGCSTTCAPTVTKVAVAVPVPCEKGVVIKPDFAVDTLPIGSDIGQQMRVLRAERLQRQGYEEELEALATSCQ